MQWQLLVEEGRGEVTERDSPVRSGHTVSVKPACSGQEPHRHLTLMLSRSQRPCMAGERQESWERTPGVTGAWGLLKPKDRQEKGESL